MLKELYKASPVWFQNIMVSVKGYEFENRRLSRALALNHLGFLLQSQYWSHDKIVNYQIEKTERLLEYAVANIPFYKNDLYKDALSDFIRHKTFSVLPVLEKSKVKQNEILFLNPSIPQNKLRVGFTSGTTGSPMKFFTTKESFSKRWAHELRMRKWVGLKNYYHPRRVQFTGRDIVVGSNIKSYSRFNYFANTLLFSSSHLSMHTIDSYYNDFIKFNPEFMDGYPSAISTFIKLALSKGYKFPELVSVRLSGEVLFKEDESLIKDTFNCKIANQYGASEGVLFSGSSSENEILVSPEFSFVEAVDEENNSTNHGEILCTAFGNQVMPLIRYKLGDRVRISQGAVTKEGRNFQVLEEIDGRKDDILKIPGFGYVGRLDPVFKGMNGILEAQIIQSKPLNITVKLVPANDFHEVDRAVLVENLRNKIGNEVHIEIKYVNKIERGANGKFKTVVSLCN